MATLHRRRAVGTRTPLLARVRSSPCQARVYTAVAACFALFLIAGCKKSESTPAETPATASPSASPRGTATPGASATPGPSATPQPRASAAPSRSPGPARSPSPTPVAAAQSKPTTTTRSARPSARVDQDEAVRISAEAGLPVPPDLNSYTQDVAELFASTIREAATKRTADSIGMLGCLYHAVMTNREDSERAQQCYEKAKELDAKSYAWPHLLGRLFLRRQSTVRARKEFNLSIELKPDYPDNYGWLADLELADGAVEEARKHYLKMVELVPQEAYGYLGLADIELKAGNTEKAKSHLDQAAALDPRNRRYHAAMADYYAKTGQEELAARHRGFADQSPPASITHNDPVNLLLARAAGPTTLALRRVRSLATSGDQTEAFKVRDALLAEYPNSAVLLTGSAEISILLGRNDEAMQFLRSALAINPDFTRALVALADCLAAQNKPEEALVQAERALDLDPTLVSGYVAQARVLRMLERGDEALAAFKKALELQPESVMLRTTVGELLFALGRFAEAKEWCVQIVRTAEASGTVPPTVAPAYVTLGNLAHQEGSAEGAARNFTKALQADPTLEPVFRKLAELLLQLGRGEDALRIAEQLRGANPQILEYAISYGDLLTSMGKSQEAIAYFEKLSKELPTHPAPRYSLAVIYREQRQFDKVKVYANEAIKLQPAYEGAWLLLLDVARTEGDEAAGFDIIAQALQHIPDSIMLKNSQAWMLATTPDESRRDGKRAVEIAEEVAERTQRQAANYLDTLACAYATAGRLDDAIRVGKEAIALAETRQQMELVQEFKERVALFETGQPFIEKLGG